MKNFAKLADEESIRKTVEALKANGINAIVVENGKQAKEKVLELLPMGTEVMNMTSVTLDTIGISKEITESGRYRAVRTLFSKMDSKSQGAEMQKLGAAPQWAIGSVHAVTEDGKVLVASATGSQLPAYAYGSGHVIWVVGAQKIVRNEEEGMKRIYDYVLPLENERARKVYRAGSSVNKMLILHKEAAANRITMIFVREKLGF